jgi:hypothetical protein
MSTELDEALSAMMDGEVTDTGVLLRALEQPDAIATLRALALVRAAVVGDDQPRPAAVASTRAAIVATPVERSRGAMSLRWAAAATMVLAVGIAIGIGVSPRTTTSPPTGPRPPAADLVAEFSFDGAKGAQP